MLLPTNDPNDQVARQFQVWKDALIDLSRRNPLLLLSPKAKSNLRLDEPVPSDLFPILTQRRKSLLFVADVTDEQDVLFEEPRRRKTGSVTLRKADFKTLNTLRQKNKLITKEQGINTLFVAFGLLEWQDPQSRIVLLSPLLLVPVDLERTPGDDSLRLRRHEDDIEFNPTLSYRLGQRDIQLTFPPLPDEDNLQLEEYLNAIEGLIGPRPGWKVRRECYIGRFSFLKLVMYKDLEAQASGAPNHPIVAALAGNAAALLRLPAVAVPSVEGLDDAIRGKDVFQILDADPSQQCAVWAAREGQSFVLQGPPGTGKTQTIANIITECIASGKRILFVSQKMVALDAVFKRLQDNGLADLCLQAHSHKATKKEVLDQLGCALNARPYPPPPDKRLLEELGEEQRYLNTVAAELHCKREPLRLSLYEAHGLVARAWAVPDLPFVFIAPEAVSGEEYRRLETLAEQLASYHSLFSEVASHPWRGLRATSFNLNLQTQARIKLGDLVLAIDALEKHTELLASLCCLPMPMGLTGSDWLIRVAQSVATTPRPPPSWLVGDSVDELRHRAEECHRRYDAFNSRRTVLLDVYDAAILSLNPQDIVGRLNLRHDGILRLAFGDNWAQQAASSGGKISDLLGSLSTLSQRLGRSLAVLAPMCGLANDNSVAGGRYAIRVARLACVNPHPQRGWFEPGAIASLSRQLEEARSQHEKFASGRDQTLTRYTDGVFSIDAEALALRFRDDYATVLRYFKPGFYRDRRLVISFLRPESKPPEDVAGDISLVADVRVRDAWIRSNETRLSDIFGIHYRGQETEWDNVRNALSQVEEITRQFPGGSVPASLKDRLVASEAEIEALDDIRQQAESQFMALNEELKALTKWRDDEGLPFTDQPLARARLDAMSLWACEVKLALDDHILARATVISCRKPVAAAEVSVPSAAAHTRNWMDNAAIAISATDLARDVMEAQALVQEEEAIQAEGDALHRWYAGFYQGLGTDWERTIKALQWAAQLRSLFPNGVVPAALVSVVTSGAEVVLAEVRAASEGLSQSRLSAAPGLEWLSEMFPPERLQAVSHTLPDAPYPAVRDWLRLRLDRLSEMERWIRFQNLRSACEDAGLLSFFETAVNRVPAADDVVPGFRKRFHHLWLDAVSDRILELRQFRGDDHLKRIARFAALDMGQIDAAPDTVRARASARRPASQSNFGEVGVLRAQLNRKRPQAIRTLFQNIPNLLFSLKPCLMMSPLTVSLFLDPSRVQFDTVIFDEASQIFVQDAIGALLRAPQAIIAGDSKQLPPTSFFLNLQEDGEVDEDDDDGILAAGEFESVLKAAGALAIDRSPHFSEHALEWHYRSRNESLIAFSRKHFYQTLKTFPAAVKSSAVSFVHVAEGVYHSGKGQARNNPAEAARVADLVLAHVRERQEQSLGVITFSQSQQEAIQAKIDELIRRDPSLEAHLSGEGTEGFFVKNIENVQGDERDVILISVGYGRDPNGNLTMRFGPINTEGGERRLNVAITRSREKCIVISSMLPADIVSDRPGPRLLREYMEFARGGASRAEELVGTTALEPGDFERAVADALTEIGYPVLRQVGLFDYRVDLAILDKDNPQQYLIGIECDGPMYRDAETARARDRLRPSVLEALGWRLVRLWSSDWVRDPDGQIRRLEEAIAQAQRGDAVTEHKVIMYSGSSRPINDSDVHSPYTATRDDKKVPSVVREAPAEYTVSALPPGVVYYESCQLALPGASDAFYSDDNHLRSQFLRSLVEHEGPLSMEMAVQRLAEAAGLARTGNRIRGIIEETVEDMVCTGQLELKDGFLWPLGMEKAVPRVPRQQDNPRPIGWVCREEIGELVIALLRVAYGMKREELVVETGRLLGYRNTGANIRERISDTLSMLELDLRIHVQGGQVRSLEV